MTVVVVNLVGDVSNVSLKYLPPLPQEEALT